jgi:hypothetical protein
MAVKTIKVADANEAFEVLSKFAIPDDSIVFRGHSKESWRLESTLARHVRGKLTKLSIQWMSNTLDHFFACLASIGKLPARPMSARTKLEYARHYGVPSPLIDFTRSPYMALWMAFNGVRPWDNGNAVIYVLDVNGLGILWQKYTGGGGDAFDEFRWSERAEQFTHGYPIGILRFLEFPSSWNIRMLRQLGVFIYDSLEYGKISRTWKNLLKKELTRRDLTVPQPSRFTKSSFQRLRPLKFTAAACSGLRSAHDCRPRRTFLHLSYSCATPFGPAILVTQDPTRTLLHCSEFAPWSSSINRD